MKVSAIVFHPDDSADIAVVNGVLDYVAKYGGIVIFSPSGALRVSGDANDKLGRGPDVMTVPMKCGVALKFDLP